MGERFRDFGNAYCGRQVACDVIPREERRACVDEEVESSCFEERDCNSWDYYLHEDMWESCLDALDNYDCGKVEQGLAPDLCTNAWRPPGHRL
jgi:hypothetical protein